MLVPTFWASSVTVPLEQMAGRGTPGPNSRVALGASFRIIVHRAGGEPFSRLRSEQLSGVRSSSC